MSFQSIDVAGIGIPSNIGSEPPDISDPFLSSFTHDLRSPLFALLGYLQLLEKHMDKTTETEKIFEYLRLAREAGHRLDQMVAEMLDLARFGHGTVTMKMSSVSVSDIFRRLWGTFHVIAQEKGLSLRLVLKDDQALTVLADTGYIERALDNLLANAIKFNVPGGQVVVTAARQNSRVIFQVSDTGRGIPLEAQDRLFQPFAQLRASDRSMGFGLGLSIVKFIAKAHGGDVELTSHPGEGSRFTLWIPEHAKALAVSK